MSKSELARFSRDGDQFHYLWAARRCLRLLTNDAQLVAISVEGSSPNERSSDAPIEEGEQVIDLAEYYGSDDLQHASRVRYLQLKHSTTRSHDHMVPSDLKKTLRGFAERFEELCNQLSPERVSTMVEFVIVTNRPIDSKVHDVVADESAGIPPRNAEERTKLQQLTSLGNSELQQFCSLLRLEDNQDGYWDQRNLLLQDVAGYLPDQDRDAPVQLKELVVRKALSESTSNPVIFRNDVLRALGVSDPRRLFPAPRLIKQLDNAVPRAQEASIAQAVANSPSAHILVTADAGVGKSILATKLGHHLPEGSVCVVYDCFGNGQYRSVSMRRHTHDVALVQIVNELAALGLCHPLIPTKHADASSYIQSFLHRIAQAVSSLKARASDALLCIVVDAADNAEMHAQELDEPHSFAFDILKEQPCDGTRLVLLCRPYRKELLDPSPTVLHLTLDPFTPDETSTHLRAVFPDASDSDSREFHRLSTQNPRVQALALSVAHSVDEALRLLGPNPTNVESTIEAVLQISWDKVLHSSGSVERAQMELMCQALAALRPQVPISVMAEVSGIAEEAIRSFVTDLGRPLMMVDDSVMFADEPTETWFRKRFKPDGSLLTGFVGKLTPFASTSDYVASSLPQLMLEAGAYNELIQMTLLAQALPDTHLVSRREIEFQRLQFALKAALRRKRYSDAAKLALRCGRAAAGEERLDKLLQDNTDLLGSFLSPYRAAVMLAQRPFRDTDWMGSRHAYIASLLSCYADKAEARSHLRLAEDWLRSWFRLPKESRKSEGVSNRDIAEIAFAHLNIHGAETAAAFLRGWTPRWSSYGIGLLLARRLSDLGQNDALDELASAARGNVPLILAVVAVSRTTVRSLPPLPLSRCWRLVSSPRIDLRKQGASPRAAVEALADFIVLALKQQLCTANDAATLLRRYLPSSPPRYFHSQYDGWYSAYPRGRALLSALTDEGLTSRDLMPKELVEVDSSRGRSQSNEIDEFNEFAKHVVPWLTVWGRAAAGKLLATDCETELGKIPLALSRNSYDPHQKHRHAFELVACLHIDTRLNANLTRRSDGDAIMTWLKSGPDGLSPETLLRLTRICAATPAWTAHAFEIAGTVADLFPINTTDADTLSVRLVEISRSLLAVSRVDAEAYFDRAVEFVSKVGEENTPRWNATIELAEQAAAAGVGHEVVYKFARCAELTKRHTDRDKNFPWDDTIEALVALDPQSALALAARWRDRGLGPSGRILSTAIQTLVDRGLILSVDALPFTCFEGPWNRPALLQKVIEQSPETEVTRAALRLVSRYMSLEEEDGWGASKWNRLAELTLALGQSDEYALWRHKEQLAQKAAREPSRSAQSSELELPPAPTPESLTTPQHIHSIHKEFIDKHSRIHTRAFFDWLLAAVPAGKEPEFISACTRLDDFGLYEFRHLLEAIPPNWKPRLGIRKALRGLVRDIATRFSVDIIERHYDPFPFGLAVELSELTTSEVLDVTFTSVCSKPLGDYGWLFRLAGWIGKKLEAKEALEALEDALSQFDDVLTEHDGDGPWSPSLVPADDIMESLGGYVWSALASPEAATRWEAAHVVVASCALNRTYLVNALVLHSERNTTSPFASSQFRFYSLHARQWFLIAMARAVLEHPELAAEHIDYFQDNARNTPHAIIRLFASRVLLELHKRGLTVLSDDDRDQMERINTSPFPPIAKMTHADRGASWEQESHDYFFGFDMGPYWLKPLGACFGLPETEVFGEAKQIVASDLGHHGSSAWDADARAKARMYREGSTHHSHGSYPDTDDLHFYLSYHAMMLLTGRLLASRPMLADPLDYHEQFTNQFASHYLSRSDGYWLADRRDPTPMSVVPVITNTTGTATWSNSTAASEFEQSLLVAPQHLAIWGRWTVPADAGHQVISIHSALVSPFCSVSLLAALQTANNPHHFRIPDADDERQLDEGDFRLLGWVFDRSGEGGIDIKDPWAGNVRFPAPEPGPHVVETLALATDRDRRYWCADSRLAFWSETWGAREEDREPAKGSGRRLIGTKESILRYLSAADMDLIVEVQLEKNLPPGYGSDELSKSNQSTRMFLLTASGTLRTL